jgi:hypothetical protein
MKIWKTVIRIWFTLASLASFLVGWSVLAHAPKPNQFNLSDVPSMPKLDPVPSLNEVMLSGQSNDFIQPSQNFNQQALVLRSGGS